MNPTFDAHIHLWERRWEGFVVGTSRVGRFAQRDLVLSLMDRYGVERACVLGACNKENSRNNEFVAELCRADPDRFVMISAISLADPARDQLLEKTISKWPAFGFRGNLSPNDNTARWCGAQYEPFWERANAANMFAAFNLGPAQAAALRPLIQRYSGITWLLDHMAQPRHDTRASTYEQVLRLAAFPSVYVKISGFYAGTEHSAEYPYHDLAPFVQKLLRCFGARRLLWGSDVPPVLDFSSYEQSFSCLAHLLPKASAGDLKAILGGTARQLFRGRKP